MLSINRGKQINTYVKDYVLFDLETTGLSCYEDQVIELSALKVRDGQVTEEFSSLVNPQRPIPFQASMVNHITDEMVANMPTFDQVLADFIAFAGDDVLVGHNIASFDLKFIYRDCEKFFGQTLDNDFLDTLKFGRMALKGLESYTLVSLADHFQLETDGAHRALNDCKMNQQVFELLAKEIKNCDTPICPKCGSMMVKRRSVYGEFFGCGNYPNCKQIVKI